MPSIRITDMLLLSKVERIKKMGLAASQARFLAITSRKMNCEFQSMQIAQDKLSVTRDLQSAATKYQNSMNATKLVWDTDMDEVYDLSYDLLMTPSALNDYNPYLITDAQGKIVLTDTMFNAAKNAGIIDENGNPTGYAMFTQSGKDEKQEDGTTIVNTKGSRDAFLDALVSCGDLSYSTAESVKSQPYTNAGMGGELLDKTIANALTTTGFINKLSSKDENGTFLYPANLSGLLNGATITKNGTELPASQVQNLTLGDLLNGNYVITSSSGISNVEDIITTFAKTLGYGRTSGTGLNVDDESNYALTQALEFTKLDCNKTVVTDSVYSDNQANSMSKGQANAYNGIVQYEGRTATYQSISLTNILKSYLTNFAIMMDGVMDTYFHIDDSAKESTYVTDDLNYYFLLEAEGSVTETDILTADFYNQLYNQICLNGATTDAIKRDMVSDPEYLMQALKNGQLFISSLNTDGYFYQGAYTLNGYVAEVTDEEAIAQAEMEYEITKSKLNYKEETLDLKMKNIDTELSALTTEYDTVKNLISKNVEKVFTMFST